MSNLLSLKMGQSLSMTPALQQAIKLLQMASIDLQGEIQEALDSNLMLESDEPAAENASADATPNSESDSDDSRNDADSGFDTDVIRETIPDEPGEDFSWNDVYSGSSSNNEAQQALQEYRQASLTAPPDLHEHILEQVRLLQLSPAEETAAAYIIDALDERGYINEFEALAADIQADTKLSPAEIERVLSLVQNCDPPGVAARNLAECLRLQLLQLPESEARNLATQLVAQSLNALAAVPIAVLARQHGTTPAAIEDAQQCIRMLQPHPGARFIDHEASYVSPDLFVRKRADKWEVHLNPEIAPRIRINSGYQAYIRRGDASKEQQTLKNHLAEARHFIHALRSRNETLLRVGQQIIDLQRGFLEYGPEAMKPLVLRDIADRLGLHESTVSRATASKYMHTPRGLFELKYFFSSSVSTAEGGSCSATAIQAMIKRFVAAENPGKPLSDARLAQMLQDEGVSVARRTIAKYRETLGIPPTHERRVRA